MHRIFIESSEGFIFEAHLTADVSTRYITKKDGRLMDGEAPHKIAQVAGDYGAIFHLAEMDQGLHEMRRFGFSEHFTKLCWQAHKAGFQYIRFDGSGGDVKGGAKTFKW